MVFRMMPHGRLQEWVAEENGFFADEGLEYSLTTRGDKPETWSSSVQNVPVGPPEVKTGAFEAFEAGRSCDVSSACHWVVNEAAANKLGQMYGKAYSVTPAGIYVPPESEIRRPDDLAGVDIAVGYHSGSHFSARQHLETFLTPGQISLKFIGLPLDRLTALLDRSVPAGLIWGAGQYLLEQQGFRKIVDATFMIGFMFDPDVDETDIERYFSALRRAQQELDLQPEKYRHYHLKSLPDRLHHLVDVRGFGMGERIVFLDYTQDTFARTQHWMHERDFFEGTVDASGRYTAAVRQ